MGARESLQNWVQNLVGELDNFQKQISSLESSYQTTWQSFQNSINDLLQPASGPDAYTGEAANAMRTAFNQFIPVEQEFQKEHVIGQALQACNTCHQSIEDAIINTSSRMVNLDLVDEALTIMTVEDIVKYGRDMVPSYLVAAYDVTTPIQTVQGLPEAIAASLAYAHKPLSDIDIIRAISQGPMDAHQTMDALCDMADQIKAAVTTWNSAIVAISNEPWSTAFTKLKEGWGLTNASLELAGKINKGTLKEFSEFMERRQGSVGLILALIGFGVDFLTGRQYNEEALGSDAYGAGIAFGLEFVPGVDVAEDTLLIGGEAIHDASPAVAWAQDGIAGLVGGNDQELQQELKEPAKGIKEGGENVDFGAVFDDIGGVVYNALPAGILSTPTYATFHGSPNIANALNDGQRAVVDTGRAFNGVYQVGVDTIGAGFEDFIANPITGISNKDDAKKIVHGINSVLHWLGG